MARTNSFKNEIAKLVFNNVSIADIGDASGLQASTATGVFYISLYSVMPTETTNGTEAAFTGYARVTVARTTLGWTVSGINPVRVTNTSAITFASSTSSETILGAGISYTLTGTPKYFGTFTNVLNVINGSVVEIQIGQLKISFN